ncbi:MAG: hybrid sensor histidine kinase/response regulator [Chloroflexota bacterium]
MIRPDASAAPQSDAAERLLDCSLSPLPLPNLSRNQFSERLELLLEWMVGVVGASTGLVALVRRDGHLRVGAAVGLDAGSIQFPAVDPTHLAFGLIVHAADLDAGGHGHTPSADGACFGLVDDEARMAIRLPLSVGDHLLGIVQIGFATLKTVEPAEIRRLGMIADHIATTIEANRLQREHDGRQTELERVSALLSEIDRMKGDFLSMISHELRTPLTAIIGYTDLLLRQIHGPLTERQLRHQQSVKKAAHRLLALINDLLDLNRLEGGHVTLNLESVALVDAVRLAVVRAAETAVAQGVELRQDLPATSVAVSADPERLHQILLNLLDNAIKFTPSGGTVTVRLDHDDQAATISVIDTGVGVPAEQIERIWDRFHQADSSTRRQFGGTGLGLAIVRHLVELHGGAVSVASDGPDRGSTFSLTIPTVEAPELRPLPPAAAPPAPLARSTAPRTVLIVDDEPDNRELISSVVRDVLGHAVTTATNGPEALAAARDRADLILLDLRMPGMSGFEVARTLKSQPETAQIPIVAITALAADGDRRDAMSAGCVGCVTKPFAEEALAAAVSEALAAPASAPGR